MCVAIIMAMPSVFSWGSAIRFNSKFFLSGWVAVMVSVNGTVFVLVGFVVVFIRCLVTTTGK